MYYSQRDFSCLEYQREVKRIETQAKEYQRRFNEWCATQKHRCKIIKENAL